MPELLNHKPLVSICCITYNHALYISQAIQSFLDQETLFGVEILISDDASTDDNQSIIKKFVAEYPDRLKVIVREQNIGMINNFFDTLSKCQGKYIALCEGDDYWIDPLKLQKQVGFLEQNNDYGMVCTDYHKYYQNSGVIKNNCFKIKKYVNHIAFHDYILDRSTIGTATTLFRSAYFGKYLTEIPIDIRKGFNVGDTPLWLYFSVISKIKVLQEATAVYRIVDNSACHFKNPKDHFDFVMRGFDVPDYFAEKYMVDESIKKRLKEKKLKAVLGHAFKIKDKKLFIKNYNIYKSNSESIPWIILIWRFGIINRLCNHLTKLILKIYTK